MAVGTNGKMLSPCKMEMVIAQAEADLDALLLAEVPEKHDDHFRFKKMIILPLSLDCGYRQAQDEVAGELFSRYFSAHWETRFVFVKVAQGKCRGYAFFCPTAKTWRKLYSYARKDLLAMAMKKYPTNV